MAKRILIVDDHPPTLALIRAVLEAEKYQDLTIREANAGAEALKTLTGTARSTWCSST